MSVVIETTIGDITIDLYTSERPRTSLNFIKLCKMKYYNFCLFHKIQRDFMVQCGDPTGTGSGGESIYYHMYGPEGRLFDGELKPKIKHNRIGLISMVNASSDGTPLHGSQFFITLGNNLEYLDNDHHTVFGEISEGMDVLIAMNDVICDDESRPYKDIRITHTVILDDTFPDPQYLEFPPSPEITIESLRSNRIGVDEEIDDNDGKTAAEIEEEIKQKEAKERALVLEMIGDIPDADVKPPENVLFVCKLNPVTLEDDLEVIFSRFGTIKSCEVIRDHKSGESLQYAFIEFEKPEDCENAYFKMDNVLIDDRRIHVDFSQSVSKIKWYGKGKGVKYFDEDKGEEPQSKLIIKKSAFGQRMDKNYDYVYDEDGDDSNDRRRKTDRDESRKRKGDDRGHRYYNTGHRETERGHRNSERGHKDNERGHKDVRGYRDDDRGHRNRSRSRSRDRYSHKDRHGDKKTSRDRDSHRHSHRRSPPSVKHHKSHHRN